MSVGKVAVLGAGSWGTAFSIVLADGGNDVTIWARREEVAAAINGERENGDYLPGIQLPPAVSATHDVEKALHGADVVVLATPSQSLRENLTQWAPFVEPDAVFVSLMKGVELGTLNRMSEVIHQVTGAGPERIAVISGPNLAKEIARREPAASVVACADEDVAKMLQQRVPLAGVPALHQHRRARLRARRRLQERRRPGRRDGGRARLRRQHHRLAHHPRARRDRPAGDEARRQPADPDGSRRPGRPRRHLLLAALAQPHASARSSVRA